MWNATFSRNECHLMKVNFQTGLLVIEGYTEKQDAARINVSANVANVCFFALNVQSLL